MHFHPSVKMSGAWLEQCINVKFCTELGKSRSETLQMLTEAYGADDMKNMSVFEWHERFKEDWADVKGDKGTYFQQLTRQMRMWKECESWFVLTGKCSYDGGGIKCVRREALRKILTEDLGMKSFSKFDDQKQQQQRLDVSSNLYHQLVKGNKF
jgi:hypothetical protein